LTAYDEAESDGTRDLHWDADCVDYGYDYGNDAQPGERVSDSFDEQAVASGDAQATKTAANECHDPGNRDHSAPTFCNDNTRRLLEGADVPAGGRCPLSTPR